MKFIVRFVFLALVPMAVFAGSNPLPSQLIYKGNPIDSLCLTEHEDKPASSIALAHCGIDSRKDIKRADQNAQLLKHGFTGYNFTYVKSDMPAQGYTYYQAYGTTNDRAIIYTVSGGGGSGEFSALSLVKRSGDNISINTFASGDRCNNGIYDVKRDDSDPKNATLTYNVNITASDFLALAKDNPHKLKPYDDLEDCAACCKGAVSYSRKIGKDFGKETFNYIGIDSDLANENEPSNSKYQPCFNKVLNGFKKKGLKQLNMEQVKEFAKEFNATCVK